MQATRSRNPRAPLAAQARRQKQLLEAAAAGSPRAGCCADGFTLDEFWYSTSTLKGICYSFPRHSFLRTNSTQVLLEKRQKKKKPNNFKYKRNLKIHSKHLAPSQRYWAKCQHSPPSSPPDNVGSQLKCGAPGESPARRNVQ